MGSSFPNHDAKDQRNRHKREREREKEKEKGRLQVSTEKYRNNNFI